MTSGETRDAKTRILDAAEELIAQRGLGVALRDIAHAAGQRNNSAVQYHFTDRDGLVTAVIERRLTPMEARRHQMLNTLDARGGQPSVHELIEVLALPLLELHGTHYLRFLDTIRANLVETTTARSPDTAIPRLLTALDAALPQSSREVRRRRIGMAASAIFAFGADAEHAREAHGPRRAVSVAEIVRAVTAVVLVE